MVAQCSFEAVDISLSPFLCQASLMQGLMLIEVPARQIADNN